MCLPGRTHETCGGWPLEVGRRFFRAPLEREVLAFVSAVVLLLISIQTQAQSTAALEGQVIDPQGAILRRAEITATSFDTGAVRKAFTDDAGWFEIAALRAGTYRLEVKHPGFQTAVLDNLNVEVGKRMRQNFQLHVGAVSETVTVNTNHELIEQSTTSVGHVIDRRTVQEVPLNGRYFLDLGLLVPGSVTASQTGFSTYPSRGVGALAINTAGNREETVNYVVNGITLNNLVFSSISFQPAIDTVREFKVDNSTFSAQYGQSSGAIVNIATQSGGNQFHGELFEFIRNDALDARNYFAFTSSQPSPFKRNQFGGHIGGPIVKNRLFFFGSYEGLRQRQQLELNSLVLSDAQRASATDPIILKLNTLIPRANFVDSSGSPRFVGSETAPVDTDQWSGDVSYKVSARDLVHAFYAIHRNLVIEPNRFGNTIPGFGHEFYALRQILTINETHTFGSAKVNELRLGFNRIHAHNTPTTQLNPSDFGINNGRTTPVGLPQINIAGGALNFGGPSLFPSGRADTTIIVADNFNVLRNTHSLTIGGEFRYFQTNSFRLGTGTFNFPNVAAFIANTANSFSVTLGNQTASISESALGLFVQDNYKWRSNVTFELGLRYDWNMTPTERFDRFIVFDPATTTLRRVAHGEDVYHQNNKNVQPRVGIVWDPRKNGKTSVRAAYAVLVDQPMTSVVTALTANPPLAIPLTFSGPIRFDNALNLAQAAGLAPQTVDPNFTNAYMQSWNVNVQHELMRDLAVTVGYFGSKGSRLILRRNLNQPINGVRPFPALSPSSPILPGALLGNITQSEGSGNSSYNALWVSVTQRTRHGLQFNASYSLSKSLDYNSLSSSGVVAQNSFDIDADLAPSDYDARQRFVATAIYDLPFHQNCLVRGWELAFIVQSQSGSPVNIVTASSAVNGVALTLRPDVTGPISVPGSVDAWFDTSAFTAVPRFGNAGRNILTGPSFNNTDVSLIRNIQVTEGVRLQLRAEVFDVFNHANFGQPGNVVGTPTFGQITNTRFPTGESGSSRQIQFALKLMM
jgi:carboxypeptidase family protein/TonB-dependent receptor-like protein